MPVAQGGLHKCHRAWGDVVVRGCMENKGMMPLIVRTACSSAPAPQPCHPSTDFAASKKTRT